MPVSVDLVICTYNRASDLDRVLAAIAGQQPAKDVDCSVLVVDNASTDDTRGIVSAWQANGKLPNLRYVLEPAQGLSHARLRGYRETTGTWLAYVDDDNVLARDWLTEMAKVMLAKPEAGGLGGRVVLDWLGPRRPYLDKIGWCFAEQNHGSEIREIDSLVGAGMVFRRKALEDSGWPEHVLLEDRVGEKLVSGGDVEMVQRVRLSGHRLWYVPRCILKHRISAERTTPSHVIRLAFGLGQGSARVSAACSPLTPGEWKRDASRHAWKHARHALHLLGAALVRRNDIILAAVQAAFTAGFWSMAASVGRVSAGSGASLVGAALIKRD